MSETSAAVAQVSGWLRDDGRIVTYRQTSRDLDCDAPTAKQILETVAKESADQASTCWCVSGWTADGVYAFRLVAGNEVEAIKSEHFARVTGCHVYSVQPSAIAIPTLLGDLGTVDFELLRSKPGAGVNLLISPACEQGAASDLLMRRVERKASAQQAGASKSAGSVTGKTAPVVATSSKSTTLAKPAAATSIFARKKAVSVAAEKPAVVVKEKTAVPVVAKKAASAAPLRVPVPTTETLTSAAPVARKRAMVIFDDDEDDVEEDAAEVVPKPVTVSDEAASSAIPVHSEPAVSNSTIAPARDENGSGSGNGVEGQSIVAPESPQKVRVKKRKLVKKRNMYKDASGKLITETVDVYETCSEEEEVTITKRPSASSGAGANTHHTNPYATNDGGKSTTKKPATKKAKTNGNDGKKQTNIMSFFKK